MRTIVPSLYKQDIKAMVDTEEVTLYTSASKKMLWHRWPGVPLGGMCVQIQSRSLSQHKQIIINSVFIKGIDLSSIQSKI